jgi:hypothetical protein
LAFSFASWALRERDEYIGWSQAARIANLQYVVANDRFLIVPTVHVENLASHILALALERLPEDWQARCQVRPALVETFVDPTRYKGTCYKAANWVEIGLTAGRRDGIKKMILLKPLCKQWRDILCCEPIMPLAEPRQERPAAHWSEQEFSSVRLYDGRLKERLYEIAQDFYRSPQADIPEACGSKARTIAAYRFFQNRKITMDVILTPHTEASIERIRLCWRRRIQRH